MDSVFLAQCWNIPLRYRTVTLTTSTLASYVLLIVVKIIYALEGVVYIHCMMFGHNQCTGNHTIYE